MMNGNQEPKSSANTDCGSMRSKIRTEKASARTKALAGISRYATRGLGSGRRSVEMPSQAMFTGNPFIAHGEYHYL